MFQETKRGWEARVTGDSVDIRRTGNYQVGRKTRRRHSTLAEHTEYLAQANVGRQRGLHDRKERKKERCYTSSAFDGTKPRKNVSHAGNGSASSSDPNSSPSSSGSSSNSTPPGKDSLTIEIPDSELKQQKHKITQDRASADVPRSQRPLRNDELSHGNRISYAGNRTHHVNRIGQPRQLFRVTSDFERSSRRQTNPESQGFSNRISLDMHSHIKTSFDQNGLVPTPGPEKRMHSDLVSPRHADRQRTSRGEGLQARISPRSPKQAHFTGRPTRNFARASTKLNASQRIPTNVNLAKTLSFGEEDENGDEPEVREQRRRSKDSGSSQARSSGQLRQDSNFSRLSAQSWMSIESEETLTEREAKLLTAKTAGYSRKASGSSGASASHPTDHDPATLFGVDKDGLLLERMSNDDPYCLSVLECCTIIQIGADISKKLGFNRYEQRRVWMSPDFLRLCWTSKKSGLNEDHIKLSQVAKIKLVDRTLSVEMIGGYGLCFMFPSVTSAGLWVRALACLVPLQAQIKVPLGVTIATETEREEFSLAEDKFGQKHIREHISVNNYVTLCNPTCTPRHLGVKIAYSFSEACVYGFRYVPRQAIHFMLRTRKEIAVLKRLNHPNIVKYFEVLEDPTHGGMYTVFEHLSRGCIADSGNLQRMQIYKEVHVRMVMMDVIDALLCLHSLRISHGDVRPENILMAPNGCAKLNPIGCIMHEFNQIENRTAHIRCRLGNASPAFLAPEQCWLSRAPKASSSSSAMDVWGVGAVMYTLLYGKIPFHGSNDHQIQENICWSTMRFPIDIPMSKEAKSLMFQILSNKDPRTRMKMSEVRDHPWFSDYSSPSSSSLQTFNEFFDSSGNGSPLLAFSPEEVNNAVQQANVRVTARKKKSRGNTHRQA